MVQQSTHFSALDCRSCVRLLVCYHSVDLGLRSRCIDLTTDCTIQDSDTGKGERHSPNRPHRFWGPPSLLFSKYGSSSPRRGGGAQSSWGVILTTHRLAPRLGISGCVPLPRICAFVTWMGRALASVTAALLACRL